jgi:hypothetical protein
VGSFGSRLKLLALIFRRRARLVVVVGDREENIEILESHSKRANASGTRIVVSSGLFGSTVAQTTQNLKAEIFGTPSPTRNDDRQLTAPGADAQSHVIRLKEDADDDASRRPFQTQTQLR